MLVYLNGKLVDKEKATISVFDHGLLYGDGVFEGIRCYDRLIFKLNEHIDRLYRSADAIELKMPMTKANMIKAVIETLKANALQDAYIRLVVTRGQGDLGLDPRKCKTPTVFIITDKISLYPKEFYQKGLEIITAKTKRNLAAALDPRIKSLNYLNNILAKIDAIKSGVEEAIMLTYNDYVAECTGDNIFIVRDGRLMTPPTDVGALEGITRNAVIGLAKKIGMPFREKMLKLEEVYSADEVFLTGTAAEIIPVTKIDKRRIGDGKPGETTPRLMEEFKILTKLDGVKYAL
ncbi:MAG: branched-chain-amino-acid transaminase [Omnitrophica bacterium RIFCSPLOWO2_02_FULL_45_16]|nr:MAG: branched-chain-amino-acid transaminase [Omnitrophica bacterium RIFCSPHIGHO2_02_FULL_46_20]OGX00747.1 MAG: branched-chain-amino-acid transaminase [Omnitrophica bacterium RIFCSPLOWO2_02_FULL_45_16]